MPGRCRVTLFDTVAVAPESYCLRGDLWLDDKTVEDLTQEEHGQEQEDWFDART